MKAIGTKLPLQVALVLIVLGSAMPLQAQENRLIGSDMYVCNKGTVAVEVVEANRGNDILRGFDKYYWIMEGSTVPPGNCTIVKIPDENPSYIAFGLTDSKPGWESGTIAHVPDLGTFSAWLQNHEILTGASKIMCARRGTTYYVIDDDFSTDCAPLKQTGRGRDLGQGPLLPLTSSLFFNPQPHFCGYRTSAAGVQDGSYECEATHYYLNIYPSATDREMHATQGTESAADAAATPIDGITDQSMKILGKLLKAVMDAADAQSKQRAQAALDKAEADLKRAREQQAAREQKQKQILAADAAGNRDAKIPAQMVRREEENNRQRWAGTTQSPAAYDPRWMGQNVAVVGTVSRVEVDQNSSPQWVSIYFKESPDATFVVCSPYPDLFKEKVGLNLSALIGKTLEAAGQVESPYCGQKVSKGSIRVVESTQWKVH
ncbi:MAG: hypothetical protein ABI383_00255 [Acidobacteriaceae bacterium]